MSADRGTLFTSKDAGKNWELVSAEKIFGTKKQVNLKGISIGADGNFYIAGEEGVLIIVSPDLTKINVKRYKQYNNSVVLSPPPGELLVAAEKGYIQQSKDNGATWKVHKVPAGTINLLFKDRDEYIAAGNNGFFMKSADGIKWTGTKGTSIIILFLNFFAPFVLIWLLFLLMYMVLPNEKVPFKPAAIGASFTARGLGDLYSSVYLLHQAVCQRHLRHLWCSGGNPPVSFDYLFLFDNHSAWRRTVIYMMHPESYLNLTKKQAYTGKHYVFNAVRLLHLVYSNFETGKGATSEKQIKKEFNLNPAEIDTYLELFITHNLILTKEGGGWIPGTSSSRVKLADVINLVHDNSLDIPELQNRNRSKRFWQHFSAK